MNIRLQPTKKEWLSSILIIPILAAILNYILYKELLWNVSIIWLYSFPLTIALVLCFWYLYILSIHFVRIKLPDIKQTILRVLLLACIHAGLVVTALTFIFSCYDLFHIGDYTFKKSDFILASIIGGSATLVVTPLREGFYLFSKWKESLVQKEVVQQLSVRQEFELLKQQADPHFLFNCLNTLSFLISEDMDRADSFLSELRKVYHYLLNNKKEDFVTLEKELGFIQSYFALLETRFGNAIELKIAVNQEHLERLIPSLSLQLLIENAVKHNIASKEMRLLISITSTFNDELIVTNNLQPKLIKSRSFGIGMETIKAKYKLIQQKSMEVRMDEKYFTVILPFISKSQLLGKKLASFK